MMSCGMYNGAGKWITEVGIPAKSGVAGLVMGVVPGVCGIAVFSPRLDQNGNSFRGVEVAKLISERFDLHVLRAKKDGSASADKPRGDLPDEPKRRKSRAKGGSSCSGSRISVDAPTTRKAPGFAGSAARPSGAYQDLSSRGGSTAASQRKIPAACWEEPPMLTANPTEETHVPPSLPHVIEIIESCAPSLAQGEGSGDGPRDGAQGSKATSSTNSKCAEMEALLPGSSGHRDV